MSLHPDKPGPPAAELAAEKAPAAEPRLGRRRVAVAMQAPGRLDPFTISRSVLTLALPALGEQFLMMLLFWSDLYLAGSILPDSKVAIAAVGIGGQLMFLTGVFFTAVGVGATAIVARAIGAGDRDRANRTTHQALLLGILIGSGLAVLLTAFAPQILWLLRLEPAARSAGAVYVRHFVPALAIGGAMFMGAACLRGAGDTRSALLVVGLSNVVNIAFSWALRWGVPGVVPAMGLRGIAIGTFIAFIFGGALMLVLLARGRGGLKARLLPLRPDRALIRRIFDIGVFSGLENLLMAAGSTFVVAFVNALGTASYAAYITAIRLESASFLPGIAFAISASSLVGQSLGAGRPDRAARCGWWAFAWGGGLMAVMGAVFLLCPGPFVHLFARNDPEVAAMAARMLRLCGAFQPALAAILIFAGALKGAGDTRFPMVITVGGVGAIRVPGAAIVSLLMHLSVVAVWAVLCFDMLVRGLLMLWRFAHGGWKGVRV